MALASGVIVGALLGVFGGGGSILATPLPLYVVGLRDPHVAIGASAAAVAVNAAVGLVGHARRGRVKWPCAAVFAATGLATGFCGVGGGFLIVPGLMAAPGMTLGPATASSRVSVALFAGATPPARLGVPC